jgi:dCMP deaminase
MKKPDRISRTELYIEVARLFSKRATCLRGQVGAALVHDKRIIATGYNGPPENVEHCSEHKCDLSKPCTHSVHAEANLIAFCAKHGIATNNSAIVITTCPCKKCSELIIQSGISMVVYDSDYRDDSGIALLEEAGILLIKYAPDIKINWDMPYVKINHD